MRRQIDKMPAPTAVSSQKRDPTTLVGIHKVVGPEPFPVNVGLIQGCVMSPWLFNVYIWMVWFER